MSGEGLTKEQERKVLGDRRAQGCNSEEAESVWGRALCRMGGGFLPGPRWASVDVSFFSDGQMLTTETPGVLETR